MVAVQLPDLVVVHPLVLLATVDHYNRVKGTDTFVFDVDFPNSIFWNGTNLVTF